MESRQIATGSTDAALRLLQSSARLLLEYNVRSKSSSAPSRGSPGTSGVNVQTLVGYREVTLATGGWAWYPCTGAGASHQRRRAVRRRCSVIDELCLDRIGLDEATRSLEDVERLAPRHDAGWSSSSSGWRRQPSPGCCARTAGAIAVSGLSSALGLVARQELARRPVLLFAQPFAAGLIGAALGGLAIRLGWTETPGFCLIVPALMLVPGPHLINGVHDMLDNHMQTGICRLGLAMGILIAAALGVGPRRLAHPRAGDPLDVAVGGRCR